MASETGRASAIEIQDLKAGMDFRKPEYRREVFLRFYEFHLKYRSHPGCVYYLFPYLFEHYAMTQEQRLWFVFINGNTQHPLTTLTIWRRFPDIAKLNHKALSKWFSANYLKLAFDVDRRYQKKDFLAAVDGYRNLLAGNPQEQYFGRIAKDGDEEQTFHRLWPVVRKDFFGFGRLSAFSYLEYLRIAGVPIDCDQLFLSDMSGSKSHRNGLAKVLGRDDLDWHKSTGFNGEYVAGQIDWLTMEGSTLREEARRRFKRRDFCKDVGYFTLESALCTYKSWYRPNRRYPNVYNDMLHARIKLAELSMPDEDYSALWAARKLAAPAHLLLEYTPTDPGVCPAKQNHYRNTGQVIMMERDWACFKNDFSQGGPSEV